MANPASTRPGFEHLLPDFDYSPGLEGSHILVTGAGGMIGEAVAAAFYRLGCKVSALDINFPSDANDASVVDGNGWCGGIRVHCDISDEGSVRDAFAEARRRLGPISVCVALAALDLSVLTHVKSNTELSADDFRKAIDVNVTGTFLTCREWLRQLEQRRKDEPNAVEDNPLKNVSLIIVGSESGRFGERTNAAYATSKGAVQTGLMLSFAADAPRVWEGARVNAVAPGPVDTSRFKQECAQDPRQYYEDAQATVPLCKPVPVEQVARTIVMLASERWSGSIHGQVIPIDGGKQGKLYYSESEARERRPQ